MVQTVSMEDFAGKSGSSTSPQELSIDAFTSAKPKIVGGKGQNKSVPADMRLERMGAELGSAASDVGDWYNTVVNAFVEGMGKHPEEKVGFDPKPIVKNIAGEVIRAGADFASLAPQGLEGIGGAVRFAAQNAYDAMFHGKKLNISGAAFEGWNRGFDDAADALQQVHDTVTEWTPTEEERFHKVFAATLNLVPRGIKMVGDEITYAGGDSKLSSAAGATAQALGYLFTMKPEIVGRGVGAAFRRGKKPGEFENNSDEAKHTRDAFDELIQTDPDKAEGVKDNVADPLTRKDIDARIKKARQEGQEAKRKARADELAAKRDREELAARIKSMEGSPKLVRPMTSQEMVDKATGVVSEDQFKNIFDVTKLRKSEPEPPPGPRSVVRNPRELIQAVRKQEEIDEAYRQREGEGPNTVPRAEADLRNTMRAGWAIAEGPWTDLRTGKTLTDPVLPENMTAMQQAMLKAQNGGKMPPGDAVVYLNSGIPITREGLEKLLKLGHDSVFWSPLALAIKALGPEKASRDQWHKFISKLPEKGVAKNEIDWYNPLYPYDDDMQILSKEQLLKALDDGGIKITEEIHEQNAGDNPEYGYVRQPGFASNYGTLKLHLSDEGKERLPQPQYEAPHFKNNYNLLAHVRFTARTLFGKNDFFVEEMQSDWGQERTRQEAVRKRYQALNEKFEAALAKESNEERRRYFYGWREDVPGLTPEEAEEFRRLQGDAGHNYNMPPTPYESSARWVGLAAKRMLRYAAEKGYDNVILPNGRGVAFAERVRRAVGKLYVTKQSVNNRLPHNKLPRAVYRVEELDVNRISFMNLSEIAKTYGKDAAKKIAEGETTINGDWEIGGEGMMKFYDDVLPNEINKLLKKIGAKLERVDIAQQGMYRRNDHGELQLIKEGIHGPHNILRLDPVTRDHILGDAVMYLHSGIPITRAQVDKVFGMLAKGWKGMAVGREINDSIASIQRNLFPETLGPDAVRAASVVSKATSELMKEKSRVDYAGQARHEFWEARKDKGRAFLEQVESGKEFADPQLARIAEAYRQWAQRIYDQDHTHTDFTYEPADNYFPHLFKDQKGVEAWLQRTFGSKFNDPGFIKERSFRTYREAIEAGFEPISDNPEVIMQMRQHASDIAQMRHDVLTDLETYGLARKGGDGEKEPGEVFWRSPSGQGYLVKPAAAQILHNAWNSPSLWNQRNLIGTGFRGIMAMKNTLIPIKLGLSLFHPLHVATLHNAATFTRLNKELLARTIPAAEALPKMIASLIPLSGVLQDSKAGWRIMDLWRRGAPGKEISFTDKVALQLIAEGGFIPAMSHDFQSTAMQKWRNAVAGKTGLGRYTNLRVIPAIFDAMQRLIFNEWIPALKTASYLKDVAAALKVDPALIEDNGRRIDMLRQLKKSVDNRYGEMAYSDLFWNRAIKDIAVASTLSLGWQLGFMREYGGVALDTGRALTRGSLKEGLKRGEYDKLMFTTGYTGMALLYGGLLTWAMTGQWPQQLIDYVFPQTGQTDADGKPDRVGTMFYAAELFKIAKHIQTQGAVSGLTEAATNKANPTFSMMREFATGINYMGQEITDPNAPAYKRLEQRLLAAGIDMLPISTEPDKDPEALFPVKIKGTTGKEKALAVLGFTPAPKYVTETPIEAEISSRFREQLPQKSDFVKAANSRDAHDLREFYLRRDQQGYEKKLAEMQDKYEREHDKPMTERQVENLRKRSTTAPTFNMFKGLSTGAQKELLDKMSPEEREAYLPFAHKVLREEYESAGN